MSTRIFALLLALTPSLGFAATIACKSPTTRSALVIEEEKQLVSTTASDLQPVARSLNIENRSMSDVSEVYPPMRSVTYSLRDASGPSTLTLHIVGESGQETMTAELVAKDTVVDAFANCMTLQTGDRELPFPSPQPVRCKADLGDGASVEVIANKGKATRKRIEGKYNELVKGKVRFVIRSEGVTERQSSSYDYSPELMTDDLREQLRADGYAEALISKAVMYRQFKQETTDIPFYQLLDAQDVVLLTAIAIDGKTITCK